MSTMFGLIAGAMFLKGFIAWFECESFALWIIGALVNLFALCCVSAEEDSKAKAKKHKTVKRPA